ncbi:hypothetical protein KPL71_001787 [Citrus sinensis]|uniref:Uncharacterized protein n=1 Tax=Citrus sinensis TaxID=2711 RepID=A0ACB8P090_CITSI|nr:hypothetical protein KPL71_001787 [Citrus sinensis]
MTETTRLHVMKEVESCQTNTESSRDEKEDAKAQERKRAAISTVINILESKHDRSLTSSKTECLQDSSFYSSITIGGHPTNHPGSVMAVIKQEVTGSEEKSEDFVNDQIPLDKKTNMECLRYEKEVAEYQERKGATVLTAPNLSDFRNSEIECFEDGSSYSPPPKLVSSKRSNQKNPKNDAAEGTGQNKKASENENSEKLEILCSKLASFYSNVMVVDNVSAAKKVVWMLTNKYKHLVHACDTEVAKIDVKQETPVDHGEVICFSIYSGPEADFGSGKSCIWVDLLDGGGRDLLNEFAPFFEDPSIKKVWHNYSFDNHVLENYGLKVSGFHADTMHMAQLWDSSRRTEGGYSLKHLQLKWKLGMLFDREYLSEIEKVARAEQEAAVNRFRKWASKHCPDAK